MKFQAVISDIDETLAPLKKHSVISANVKTHINKLHEIGISFCLATGKPFGMVVHLIDELGLTSPIITDNGAAIFDTVTQKPLWISSLPSEIALNILSHAQKYHKRIRFSDGFKGYDYNPDLLINLVPVKLLIMGLEFTAADDLVGFIKEHFTELSVYKTSAYEGNGYCDIYVTAANATKSHAVKFVADRLNIKPAEIIGIGDHYNDIPLLNACGFKVAMGNAVDELKKIADYIAPSVDEDGVADVIDRYILNKL